MASPTEDKLEGLALFCVDHGVGLFVDAFHCRPFDAFETSLMIHAETFFVALLGDDKANRAHRRVDVPRLHELR